MRNFVYWTICGWITGKGDQDLGNNIPDPSICCLSTAVTLHEVTQICNFLQICYTKVYTLNNELTYQKLLTSGNKKSLLRK